ncbi:hypothetical protein BX600DRAFT_515111 [Xylariales sp. PMI_506]|nr:hypothetical protein BX600DRAFT_515111 [Xylariales sp. PMI_506]
MRYSAYLLALFPAAALATVNGHCSGSSAGGTATGDFLEYGICVSTTTCGDYGGVTITGGCPNDASNIKCCLIGLDSSTVNPCGGASWCEWTADTCSGTRVPGYCPGGSNYECCKL